MRPKLLLFLLLCLIIPGRIIAQAKFTVTGVVKSEDGQPLTGVSVKETGSQKGTTTDANGRYQLVVSSDQSSLEFSYVGYLRQKAKLNGHAALNIFLRNDLANGSLKDVVV